MFGHDTFIQKSYLLLLFELLGMRNLILSSLYTAGSLAARLPAHTFTRFPHKNLQLKKSVFFFLVPIRIPILELRETKRFCRPINISVTI